MRVHLSALALAALAACADRPLPADPSDPGPGPADAGLAPAEPGRYIVVFKPDVADPRGLADHLVAAAGGQLHFRYGAALKGFAATLPVQALEGIRRNPNVDFIEEDGVASVSGPQNSPPSWGLDRVDDRVLPLDASYEYANDGSGVRVYVLDTGVWPNHAEYAGRVGSGWDFVDNDADANDCHGHGTHVAGTVAGSTVGVAKGATVISVRVLNCLGSGSWSQIIAGIDWVMANHVKPAVANMSLSGGASSAVNAAVNNAVAAGVTVAVAAGNDGRDACGFSPASAAGALTTGATTSTDARAAFSNFGGCVDLFAPGAAITSSVRSGGYETWNGTSMASPHVAGVAALYLAAVPGATPAEVAAAILGGATGDRLSDVGTGSPNRLLFSQIAGPGVLPPLPPPPPPAPSPVAAIADLDGSASAGAKNSWSAAVTVLVMSEGQPVAGAAVSGSWSQGASGSGSCTTGADGRCTVHKGGLKRNATSVQFGVYNVTIWGLPYDPARNADPDGDSDGTSIRVVRP